MRPTIWRKSSFSAVSDSNCVEVAFASTQVAVRDSKNAAGPTLSFEPRRWRALVTTTWRKSSFSAVSDSNCVEVAFAPAVVAVRDSKNTKPTLAFDPEGWRALVMSVSR